MDRKSELDYLKTQCDIMLYLAGRGIYPCRFTMSRDKGRIAWYLSPISGAESLAVYVARNDWYDFDARLGGSVIDLVMALDQCSYSDALFRLRGCLKNRCGRTTDADCDDL